ncbi:M56 family metallopeptidase [Mesonia maritima]|uniref:Uncharacterized protein YrzB (UPF0473 family) n=1 Tax=Mesonia maritima TaxID=1793873 RepID=A0ABU1K6H6_9FLAO|nr:M56 family metallopeptidase [Mesonia maritima]MDR6300612.1 uncharacterized protein YrzB (UPF0473 family) [Mesonia maritima]
MESFFTYSWKVALLLSLWLIFYRLFLANNTLFEYKRIFLASGLLVSVLLPFFYIHEIETVVMPTQMNAGNSTGISTSTNFITEEAETIDWFLLVFLGYISGVIFCLLKFFFQFYSLLKIISGGKRSEKNGLKLVEIETETTAFSFLRTIVYNPTQYSAEELTIVLTHEKIHARELHTLDILLAELFICFQWFNPFAWFYKKDIVQNLEFLTDQKVIAAENSKELYQLTLLKSSTKNAVNLLANQFHHSFIKKRIFMLNKNRTTKFSMLKTLILIPFLALFLFGFNVKHSVEYVSDSNEESQVLSTYIIAANTSDKELNSIERKIQKDFLPAKVEFSEIQRNKKGELINLNIKTRFHGNKKFSDHVSKTTSAFPLQLTVESNRISVINATGHISTISKKGSKTGYKNLHKLGKKPLYIINGKQYTFDELTENKFSYQTKEGNYLEFTEIHPAEAIKKYGEKAKDGVMIVNETKYEDSTNKAKITEMSLKFDEDSDKKIKANKTNEKSIAELVNKNKILVLNGIKNKPSDFANKYLYIESYTKTPQGEKFIANINGLIFTKEEYSNYLADKQPVEQEFLKFDENGKASWFTISFKVEDEKFKQQKIADKSKPINARQTPNENKTIASSLRFENAKPIVYINGKKSNLKKLNNLNEDNIEKVNILKGEEAIEKYGKKAKYGVILVTTK